MGPLNDSQVCLQRDALSTPWGFRLQGGKDFKTPLTVQRVFVGSPADGELHRGDMILGINGYDAGNMIHKQAQDLIKNAGGTINLIVRRSSGGPIRSVLSPQSRQGFAPPGADQSATYRSRGLDTFYPKPAPPIGSVVTNAQAGKYRPSRSTQRGFVPYQFGTDYSQPRSFSAPAPQPVVQQRPRGQAAPGSMLNRVQDSLSSSTGMYGGGEENGENYTALPVNQIKQMFSQPPAQPVAASRPRPRPASHSPARPSWQKPTDRVGVLPDPGWSPVKAPQAPRYPVTPAARPAPVPVNRPAPVPVNRLPPAPQQQAPQDNFTPAWAGSLKSSGGPKQWEMKEQNAIATGGAVPAGPGYDAAPVQVHKPRVQNTHYGPGASAPQYQQQSDSGASNDAKVAHLQYNTPIGLYSKQNVNEVLKGQTAGRPGEGTMQVTGGGPGQKAFDPNRSEVLRLLQEEERPRPRGHGLRQDQQPQQQQQPQASPQQSARYEAQSGEMQYQGYMDHSKQSPMMHALENQMAEVQVGDGTSDF